MSARKFLVPIDLQKNELQNATIQNLATAPSSPATGQIYYNTVENTIFVYNGSAWTLVGGISYGTSGSRPTAGSSNANLFYYATDTFLLYYSNGTTWQQVDNFGTGLSSALSITGTSTDGTSTNYARADHTHAGPGFGSPTSQTSYGLTSTTGTATTVSHSDHTHGTPSLSTNAASNITATSSTNGSGTAPAKDDHVHGFTPGNFPISSFGTPTANVSWGSYKITSLADPTSAQDAATKNYVDTTAQGLNVHVNAVAATTANLTATYTAGTAGSDGGLGVGATLTNSGTLAAFSTDGYSASVGDRILVKNQSTATQNGVYTVTTVGSGSVAWVLTRATDYDNHIAGQVIAGDFVFVAKGTLYTGTGWVQSATGTATTPTNGIKIGTDNITFTQFSGAGTYTAGNGLSLTGTQFSFNPLSTGGLQASGSGASVKLPTNSGLTTDSTGLYITPGTGLTVSGGTISVSSTTPQKYTANIGNGALTSIPVTHNLGTLDVIVQVYDNTSFGQVECDVVHTSTTTVTLNFTVAPASAAYRVVVMG